MQFTSFRAMHGDAFLISTENSKILIDGGTPSTYGHISTTLNNVGLTAVLVTHVDFDHIGGIINLITDTKSNIKDCLFYMNHPDLIAEYQGDKVGFKHGDTIKSLLLKRGKSFIPVISRQTINMGDISILTLSPSADDVKSLHDHWDLSRVLKDGEYTYSERQKYNGDIINKSSIVFIASQDKKRILFLGDSHAKSTCDSLKLNGYTNDSPISIDLVKLSHHGSKHNTTAELLELIDCSRYYISTNGGHYGHPDKETIELLSNRASQLKVKFDIYLNYDLEDDIRKKCNFDLSNLNFIQQNTLDLT
jgi:beta-lactamase superfamily II metal-dependent hydrolase